MNLKSTYELDDDVNIPHVVIPLYLDTSSA